MDTADRLRQLIADNSVLLFMKGTPQFPQCGFSMRAVQALSGVGAEFSSVNVLEDMEARATLPQVSDWPTFPQLFIGGELVGGSDIVLEMYESGELKELVQAQQASQPAA